MTWDPRSCHQVPGLVQSQLNIVLEEAAGRRKEMRLNKARAGKKLNNENKDKGRQTWRRMEGVTQGYRACSRSTRKAIPGSLGSRRHLKSNVLM